MEIAEIESVAVSIPLAEPVAFATSVVEERDHAVVYVRTNDGTEGIGYTLGYGGAGLIANAVSEILAPMIEGENPCDTDRLWREMFDETVQIGRKGVLLRAISIVDIALWDVKFVLSFATDCERVLQPRDEVSGGGVAAEMMKHVRHGVSAVGGVQ